MRKFFVGLKDKLLMIVQTEDGFDIKEHLLEKQPTSLAFDPNNKQRIYCGTKENGLWKTENGGESWERIGRPSPFSSKIDMGDGITSSRITALAVDVEKKVDGNAVVYVGTEPSMLYFSTDLGRSWKEFETMQHVPSKDSWAFPPRPNTHFVRWITPSYHNDKHLAISIEAGAVLNTYDRGNTFVDRPKNSPIDVHTLLAHPDAPERLYAANGDGASNVEYAYAESHDAGVSWQYMSDGVEEHPYLYNMVIHPNDPDIRYVSASKNARSAHGTNRYSTIYKKIEDEPWVELAEGLPREDAYIHHLSDDPNQPGAFYAMNNFGIYHLSNESIEWKKLDLDWTKYGNQRAYCFRVREE